MNIFLVSSVVILAFGVNLVVCSSNSIVISSNSIVILGNFIVVWKKNGEYYDGIPSSYTKSHLLPPMWHFLWDLTHSCTYLQVYYMISRKKNLFNDVPNFKIRKLNFQVIQRFTRKLYCLVAYNSLSDHRSSYLHFRSAIDTQFIWAIKTVYKTDFALSLCRFILSLWRPRLSDQVSKLSFYSLFGFLDRLLGYLDYLPVMIACLAV